MGVRVNSIIIIGSMSDRTRRTSPPCTFEMSRLVDGSYELFDAKVAKALETFQRESAAFS